MLILFGVLAILISAGLIFLVVIQNSKGGGLGAAFGATGAAQMMGAKRSSSMVEKWTWYAAGALLFIAFLSNIMMKGGGESEQNTEMKSDSYIQNQQVPQGGQQNIPNNAKDIKQQQKK